MKHKALIKVPSHCTVIAMTTKNKLNLLTKFKIKSDFMAFIENSQHVKSSPDSE